MAIPTLQPSAPAFSTNVIRTDNDQTARPLSSIDTQTTSPTNAPGLLQSAFNTGKGLFYSRMAGTPEQALTSVAAMKNYLAWNGSLAVRDETGKNLLHRAAQAGNVDVLNVMLEHVAKMDEGKRNDILNARTRSDVHYSLTPLGLAAATGNAGTALLLAKTPGVDLNAKNKLGMTPLMCAESHGKIFHALLNIEGVDVKATCNAGQNVLMRAAIGQRVEDMRAILRHPDMDADAVNARGHDGYAALHSTVINDHAEAFDVLTGDARTRLNESGALDHTPFTLAVLHERTGLLQKMLSNPVFDPNAPKGTKSTPLMMAARGGNIEAAGVLMASERVDLNAHDQMGFTPLAHAGLNGHWPLFDKMMNHPGVDPNLQIHGMDLLSFAMNWGLAVAAQPGNNIKAENVVGLVSRLAEHGRLPPERKAEAKAWLKQQANASSAA